MVVYIHRSNSQTECDPDVIGPFDWVQITYNYLVRVPLDDEIAYFFEGLWTFGDGTEWTDITISANGDI